MAASTSFDNARNKFGSVVVGTSNNELMSIIYFMFPRVRTTRVLGGDVASLFDANAPCTSVPADG